MNLVKIRAYAKLNLTLDMCGKREDGYHLIDSVMMSADPCDLITLERADGITVSCSDGELSGQDNIAFKAAKSFFEYTLIKGGAQIYIEKHIPQAAGLGGGSSDAAAVIRGLDTMYSTELSASQLCEIALKVGADVPFCVFGGTARVGGIGEIIEPINTPKEMYLVIAKNGTKGSTKEMYNRLDSGDVFHAPTTEAAIAAIKNNDYMALNKNISNAFASVSGLYGMEEHFRYTHPDAVSLSGSGPSVFATYLNEEDAKTAYDYINGLGIECYLARPQQKGIIID